MKIHVVMKTIGEYDMMSTYPVIAFVSEKLANEYTNIKVEDTVKRNREDESHEVVELELVE